MSMHEEPALQVATSVLRLGRLASRVLLAARHYRRSRDLSGPDREALSSAQELFLTLAQVSRGEISGTAAVLAMAGSPLPSRAVDLIEDAYPGEEVGEIFGKLSTIVGRLLGEQASDEDASMIESLFDRISLASLQTAEDLARPQHDSDSWTSTASSFSVS